MRIVYLILLIFLFNPNSSAQTHSSLLIDTGIYTPTVQVIGMKLTDALAKADSLYWASDSNVSRISALILKANIYQVQNDPVASVKYAREAFNLAVEENNYPWRARISAFLSTQYRIIGLHELGKDYLEDAEHYNKKVFNISEKKYQISLIEHERAYYALADKQYPKALKHALKADSALADFEKAPRLLFHVTLSENIRGRAYLGLKQYEQARQAYTKGLSLLNSIEHHRGVLAGYFYMGLGQVYIEELDDKQALSYFKLAEECAKSSKYPNLNLALTKEFCDYYKRNQQWHLYTIYSNSYDSLKVKAAKNTAAAIEEAFLKKELEYERKEFTAQVFLGSIILVLVSGFAILVVWRSKKKKTKPKKIKKKKDRSASINGEVSNLEIPNDSGLVRDSEKKTVISQEVEQQILSRLKSFEESDEFLKPTISLSWLSSYCSTNTRYLSYVLNKSLGKDFNTYVNELRIFHGIEKLKTDPVFRTYKVSYLAEYLGFSSHSKFTSVFKEVTKEVPSKFIDNLEQQNQSDSLS